VVGVVGVVGVVVVVVVLCEDVCVLDVMCSQVLVWMVLYLSLMWKLVHF
jgi:hypothetical protein